MQSLLHSFCHDFVFTLFWWPMLGKKIHARFMFIWFAYQK
jgi:hypothetical protein